MAEVEERIFGATYSTYFVLDIELLLTMLPNFERKPAPKDSDF